MNISKLYVIIIILCGFFVMMHAMDDRAIVPARVMQERKVPISLVRTYVQRILWNALEHETLFVHNYLRAQKNIPKVTIVLDNTTYGDKFLVPHVSQNIQYPRLNRSIIHDKDDHIYIDFEQQEDTFFSQEFFEHIRGMPEGPTLCLCNALCGVVMLGGILILTFCK